MTRLPGFRHSPETRAKMSASHKRRKLSPEYRANISALKGKKVSLETRAKMSAAKKGKKLSPEHCANISAAKKGKKIKRKHVPWENRRKKLRYM